LYKELIETNTTLSAGSCTVAPSAWRASEGGGFRGRRSAPFARPIIRRRRARGDLSGRDTKTKAILLLAHIDTVEAKREDWTRDPFKLIEENAISTRRSHRRQGRGAIWVDTLVRFREEKLRPRHTSSWRSLREETAVPSTGRMACKE